MQYGVTLVNLMVVIMLMEQPHNHNRCLLSEFLLYGEKFYMNNFSCFSLFRDVMFLCFLACATLVNVYVNLAKIPFFI